MDIHLVGGEVEFLHCSHNNNGESFIDFKQIDVACIPAGFVEEFPHRKNRGRGEKGWLLCLTCMTTNNGKRFYAKLFSFG